MPACFKKSSQLNLFGSDIFHFKGSVFDGFFKSKQVKFLLSILLFLLINRPIFAQVCGTSGLDGPQNAVPPINTYYPLATTASLTVGSKSITLLAVPPNDPYYNLSYGSAQINPGDLILIIQMQDADIDYSNTTKYGSGTTTSGPDGLGGTGYTNLGNSGKFEYVVATSSVPLTGGTLTFRGAGAGGGCVNSYTNANATATQGQKRFQVVRVPQYSNLVLNSNITTPPYNGSVGGLIAFDVAGTMQFNGFYVDASERGFRGGYGPVAASNANNNTDYVLSSSSTKSVGKGEGVAGTPRYMWDGFVQVDNGSDGLPGGSYGRGAPANAGGGGNDHNAGGGGGANGGNGGLGGMGWQGAGGDVDPLTAAGRPGTALPIDYTRLIMGGGGGGGDANNATSGVKGGVGGGIILINVDKIDGAGIIRSNGGDGQPGAFGSAPDGAGGGGAGGAIFVRSLASSPIANLTIEAKGGKGGNTKFDTGGTLPHGPGGGGGGGFIYTQVPSATIATDVAGGASGKTNNGAGITHGAVDGTSGQASAFGTSDLPGYLQGGGSICYPELTTTLIEQNAGPSGARNAGTTAIYTLTIANDPTNGNAGNVEAWLNLPSLFKFASVNVAYTGDASGTLDVTPSVGNTGNLGFGHFNISPGDKVILTIVTNIDVSAPVGVYQASAQATYLDPTRTIADPYRQITGQINAFSGFNTTYETGGVINVTGANYDGNLLSSTAEDVYINAVASSTTCDAITDGGFGNTSVGIYPSGVNQWSPVNSGDYVQIVTQVSSVGAAIKQNQSSLKQTIQSVKPSSNYTFSMDFQRWTDNSSGCNPNANATVRIRIYDPANPSVFLVDQSHTSNNNLPFNLSYSFTTAASTTSLVLEIEETSSATPACPLFADNISISSALTFAYNTTNVTCNGANNGKLTVTDLQGAAAPYTISYSYNGGAYSSPISVNPVISPSTYDITGLAPGSYIVSIADRNGCGTTANFSITEPSVLSLSATHVDNSCGNTAIGSIDLSVSGGTAPYSYSWTKDGSAYAGNQQDLTNLPPGTYQVTVTDDNGCTAQLSVDILPLTPFVLTGSNTNLTCNSDPTGTITLNPSGGVAPYSFTWSDSSHDQNRTNMSAGSYSVIGKDALGCEISLSFTITEPPAITIAHSYSPILCYGNLTDVTLNASGGTGTLSYSKDGTNYQSTSIFSALPAGDYIFYVKDANGCVSTDAFTISQPTTALTLTESHPTILCNGTTTDVTLTATGGTGTYQYSKDGITYQNANVFSGLTAGNYTFEVKDDNGCTQTLTTTIGEPAALNIIFTKQDVSCYGDNSGSIDITVSGGTAPYTYSWDSGQSTEDLSNLAAGTETLTVTDANGCIATESVTINQPLQLQLNASKVDVTCKGSNTGSINLSVTGGTAPYTYLWNNGATTQDILNLEANLYSVTVTDASGCLAAISISITQPSTAVSLSETHINNTCFGENAGSINLNVSGGVAPYTYSWTKDGNAYAGNQQDLNNLPPGNYAVIVTDAKACTAALTITITPLAPFTVSSTKTDIKCNGSSTGHIELNLSGGTLPYSVTWNTGATSENINNLTAGTYSYTAIDGNGCTINNSITLTEPIALNLLESHSAISCQGGISDVTLTASGGVAPYQYSINGSSYQSAATFTGLTAGTYTFYVKDGNDCLETLSLTIAEPAALSLSESHTSILCQGSTSDLTLTTSGGTGAYQYSKDAVNYQSNPTFTGLTAGAYTFYVKDGNDCVGTLSLTITEPVILSLTGVNTDINCHGGTSDVTLNAAGGTGAYQYSKDGISYQISNIFAGLSAGDYNFFTKDNNGCISTFSLTITEPAALTLGASAETDATCFGTSTGSVSAGEVTNAIGQVNYVWENSSNVVVGNTATVNNLPAGTYTLTVNDDCASLSNSVIIKEPTALSLNGTSTPILCNGGTSSSTLTASGGITPYQYSKDGINYQSSAMFPGLLAGTYVFYVKDANGCIQSFNTTITEPTKLALTEIHQEVKCYGENTGNIDVTVSGGTAPYTYAWNSGQTTEDISNLVAGTYTVTITDNNGCSAQQSISIAQPAAALSIAETHENIKCFGENTGSIDITVSGGSAPYTYLWDSGQSTEDLSYLTAGTYTLTLTDANGCIATESVTISQPAAAISIAETHENVKCFGENTGSIDIMVSGGTAPYTYLWSKGQNTEDINGLDAGIYTVTVTDTHGCSATQSITISQPSAAISIAETHENVKCYGGNTGSIDITVSGGTTPYTYSWSNGKNTEDINGLDAGNYILNLTDANGCTITKLIAILQPSAPLSITETHEDIKCYGDQSGSINVTASGGTLPYAYTWSNGKNTEDLNALTAGTYTLTLTDANGCSSTQSITIKQPTKPLSVAETHQNNTCYGEQMGKIDLTVTGGTAPYTYLWSNVESTQDLSNLAGGTYTCILKDANQCQVQIAVTITPLTPFSATETVSQVKCYQANNGSISINLSGGIPPYAILWSNGNTNTSISNLAAGNYSYIAKDAYGCSIQKSITITEPQPLSVVISSSPTSCKFSKDGSLYAKISGGTPPYQVFWNDTRSDTSGLINGLRARTYSLKIIDANDCQLLSSGTVAPGNCAPSADNDYYQTLEDTPIRIQTPGVLVNDKDPDADLIHLVLDSAKDPDVGSGSITGTKRSFRTLHGTVDIQNDGSFIYTPDLNFNGIEKFIYKVSDGSLKSNYAVVTIKIQAVNDPPVAMDDQYTTLEDTPVSGSVGDNDNDAENDALYFTQLTPPQRGQIIFNADGTFTYTPAPNDNGSVNFDYQVCDPSGACDTATVTINITPVNDPPVAGDDRFYVERDKPISAMVIDNDSDVDYDPLTWTLLTQPAHGNLIFNPDGTFSYQPNFDFKGIDTYTYRTCDPSGLCDEATVTLIVQPVVRVNLTPAVGEISEGDSIAITAKLTEAIVEDATITLNFGGTATLQSDYTLSGNYQTITIPGGKDSTMQKFVIHAINDALKDPGEQVIANITQVDSKYVLIGSGSVVTIDDVYPESIPLGPDENPDINPDPLVSPNGDGQGNEAFVIYNISKYPDNEVVVFNRWGNEVFRIKGYNNEDRSFKGVANVGILTNSNKDLVNGVYYYLIYTEVDNKKKLNKGYLILKR
ncbi:MAG: tandem-95 repeat protein [Sphingobacteriales bacterium]|nr:tandem-95 repeat protein [Sphingobacteriales bacterium]